MSLPIFVAICSLGSIVTIFAGDEGMWTFDNLPLAQLEEQYSFTPTNEWLEQIRLSSLRLNDGGSGSFVSSRGLVMTNHHVGLNQVQNLSTSEADYVTNGFYAASIDEELRAPDLEIDVLVSMDNVTERIQAATRLANDGRQALSERRAEIALIENESFNLTGLRSQVVSLYRGGEFWLYRYKQYTDVLLI